MVVWYRFSSVRPNSMTHDYVIRVYRRIEQMMLYWDIDTVAIHFGHGAI